MENFILVACFSKSNLKTLCCSNFTHKKPEIFNASVFRKNWKATFCALLELIILEPDFFFKKSDFVTLKDRWEPKFIRKKNQWAVQEKLSGYTKRQTNRLTDEGYFIGPLLHGWKCEHFSPQTFQTVRYTFINMFFGLITQKSFITKSKEFLGFNMSV